MNIRDFLNKIKPQSEIISFNEEGRVERFPWLKNIYLSLVVILVGTLSFGLGRLSAPMGGNSMEIRYDPELSNLGVGNSATVLESQTPATRAPASESVVASSKGTKYHYSHCPGSKQISEANKITFSSSTEAEAAGYTLAGNCKPR